MDRGWADHRARLADGGDEFDATLVSVRLPYSLALALASAAVAAAATPAARALAIRAGALDQPGPRRVHREPIPTLGGLAIVAAMLGVAWAARFLPGPARELGIGPLAGLTLAAIPILALGIVDDLGGVSPLSKLGVQACSALVLSLFGYGVTEITNPFGGTLAAHALSAPLTVAWVLLVTNAINLIDGLDGLAAGVVALVAGTLWWVGHAHGDLYVMFFSAILLGAALGFLPFNFPSARVFMGDTGSQFLGLTVAALSLLENRKGTTTLT
ncbi:MAG: glycosyltransferase family 4 protein, partial [Gaiellaceae bacterium]